MALYLNNNATGWSALNLKFLQVDTDRSSADFSSPIASSVMVVETEDAWAVFPTLASGATKTYCVGIEASTAKANDETGTYDRKPSPGCGRTAPVCVAGRNGQGKSTLFKTILGWQACDRGKVTIAKGSTLGYLPQDIKPPEGDRRVIDEVLSAIPRLGELEERIGRLTEELGNAPDDASVLAKYGQAQAEFEALDTRQSESEARLAALDERLEAQGRALEAQIATLEGERGQLDRLVRATSEDLQAAMDLLEAARGRISQ